MSPRAPSLDDPVVQDLASSTCSPNTPHGGKDHTTPLGAQKPTQLDGFHWELNLWCLGGFALLYFGILPHDQRMWMHILLALIALDAGKYYYARGTMAGVPYTLPLVSLLAMIVHPVRFWAELGAIAMKADGLSTNTLVGNLMVFVTDPKLCRQVMTGEGDYGLYAHPNAHWLFGRKNLIYMDTDPHKRVRAILTPALFGKEALTLYAKYQEKVCRTFLQAYADECHASSKPMNALLSFRAMAASSSQESFLGPYLNDDMRQHLLADIQTFTMGFLCFPFPYLNTGLHRAIQAKHRIEQTIRNLVPKAREYIRAGHEPRCLLEHWTVAILHAAQEQGVEPQQVPFCSDENVANSVLDFLFAAQDATNSALNYALDVLDARRDVLDRMRQEIATVCKDGRIWKHKDELSYISKVANQLLHHKPPVPMVPHICKKVCHLGGHRLGKGTIVIPSITYSARVSGESIDFEPERQDDDRLFVKCLTFGAGQHKCPGRKYAESLLVVFLAVVAADYDFSRTGPRPGPDEFIYFPTLFPEDCDFVIKRI